ncbi:Lrp/AsnC family transcriptional regulator [Leucobacter albus]|uniref:Lrp/AsnC family transcriptional regulator n=1 Tax=Leucobacter albus TaxID=272210 RepID=A0ABW3TNQ6_9MICO
MAVEASQAVRRAVLRALEEDGRASYSQIAADLGLTRRLVTHIVQQAVANNEVRLTVSISPDLLGLERFAYLQVAVEGAVDPVRRALVALPESTFVADVAGVFPIDVEVRVGADPHLSRVLGEIHEIPGVRSVRTHLYESIEVNRYSPLRTGHTDFEVDEADRAIIAKLQRDGRASYRELGEASGLSAGGARLRFERLRRARAVKVVAMPVRDHQRETPSIGMGIRTRAGDDHTLRLLTELEPEFVARTIGSFNFVATFSRESAAELIAVTDRLRAEPSITAVESWANLRVLKEQYGEGDMVSVRGAAAGTGAA